MAMMKQVINFIKEWTLPCAIAAGATIYLIFALIPGLSDAADFFSPIMDTLMPVVLFLVLLVTFCKVNFHKMRPTRWHWMVCAFQIITVAMVFGLIKDFDLHGRSLILAEGVLICIIGPGATAAAVVTEKLGGNLASMTTYTFISNFLAALTIPLLFPLIELKSEYTVLQSFLLILERVCEILVLPMAVAYVIKHNFHRLHKRIISTTDLSFYLWAFSLMITTGITVKNIAHAEVGVWFLIAMAAVVAVVCFVQYAAGHYIGVHERFPIEGAQALGQKNTSFAIWISYIYLNPIASVCPGFYVLWQNIVNSYELHHYSQESARAHTLKSRYDRDVD